MVIAMKSLPLHELVRLPEASAVRRYLDSKSYRFLLWILGGFTPPATMAALIFLAEGHTELWVPWGLNLALILAVYIGRRTASFERLFRRVLIVYLLLQAAILAVVSPGWDVAFSLLSYVSPLAIPFFRLRRHEYLVVYAGLAAGAVWFLSISGPDETLVQKLGMLAGTLVMFAGTYWLATRWTDRVKRLFLADWRREVARDREQLRMREELADAREVQLSMLPTSAPQVDWLELASLSEPATEVGGDYYDHVHLPGDKLALVVGDVAGHGMASGLVLAALRGGLHLLREELADPVSVLARLDRMVQEVGPQRMYVTLQIALLDRAAGRVTVVSAGHPPLLHYSADARRISALGSPATPLGVRLESEPVAATAPLGPGDLLVLYSDGVLEVANPRGEAFGEERLRTAVLGAADRPPQAVLDAVLHAVDRFKGKAEALDDLTLVTAKIV